MYQIFGFPTANVSRILLKLENYSKALVKMFLWKTLLFHSFVNHHTDQQDREWS